MSGPNILVLDIETMPAIVETWSLFRPIISADALRQPTRVACFAAKWHDQPRVHIYSAGVDLSDGKGLAQQARALLHVADIVVTYNGTTFDVPLLQREILAHGLTPPSPFKQVDLYKVVKAHFRFDSNKLGFVVKQLGIGAKATTGGYELWQRCMAGDVKAWAKMTRYCAQDVKVTDKLYDRLLPWIRSHPNVGLWLDSDAPACPRCGSNNLTRRGWQHAISQVYQRFQCQACGAWSRGTAIERRASGETRAV